MIKNLLLVPASLMVTFGLLDLGFRIHSPETLQVNNPYKYTEMIGGFKAGVPLASYIEVYPLAFDPRGYYQQSRGGIFYFMDQFGGRWTDASRRQLKRNAGILVGDSFLYGFGLRYEDTLAYRLGQKLRPSVDFVNLSKPGADAAEALSIYEKARGKIHHEILIYGLNINDLIAFPASYLITNPMLGAVSDHSPFLKFVLQKWDLAINQPRRVQEIISSDAVNRPFYRENFSAILRMAELAKREDSSFYVLIFPILVGLKSGLFTPVYRRIQRELAERGIATIDLTGALAAYRDQDLWITPFDQHPNEVANRIFLEEAASRIGR